MTEAQLAAEYSQRYETILKPLADRLAEHLKGNLDKVPRIDRISVRAKTAVRFMGKACKTVDGAPKYTDPLDQIQDQIGARIIVLYLDDVEAVSSVISQYYRQIERREILPESPKEFGYVGKHFILLTPQDVILDADERAKTPTFFELQIKTLFQHAWSEAEHDLGYKSDDPLSTASRRLLAFTAAQAWGADEMFMTLRKPKTDAAGGPAELFA